MTKDALLELFEDKLPASLGNPYIVATRSKPYVFCAFYDAKAHELKDGRVIYGNEFRFWRPCSGFGGTKVLAGIFGLEKGASDLVCCALKDHETKAQDLVSIGKTIREMMCDIVTDSIGDWTA
jgi:hypothetical protein